MAGLQCQSAHKDAHLLVIDNAQEQTAVAGMLESLDRQFMRHVFMIHIFTQIVMPNLSCIVSQKSHV